MQFRSEDILNILGGVKKEHNDEEETKIELKDKTSNETIAEVFKPVKTRIFLEGENLLNFILEHIKKIPEKSVLAVTRGRKLKWQRF